MTQPLELSPAIYDRFRRVQSGVVCDAMGRLGLSGFMDEVRPFRRDVKLAARARTIRFAARRGAAPAGINIYTFSRSLAPGDVLVFATDCYDGWIYGENMAHAVQYQGGAGIVTDSRARDSAELAELAVACFARGTATRPPAGLEIVAADVPVSCGGAQVNPYDLVIGDADGIVVVPGERLAEVLVQVEDIDALEREQERAIRDQVPLPELLAILARKTIRK
jgi:regulator of RNase E activity RraA